MSIEFYNNITQHMLYIGTCQFTQTPSMQLYFLLQLQKYQYVSHRQLQPTLSQLPIYFSQLFLKTKIYNNSLQHASKSQTFVTNYKRQLLVFLYQNSFTSSVCKLVACFTKINSKKLNNCPKFFQDSLSWSFSFFLSKKIFVRNLLNRPCPQKNLSNLSKNDQNIQKKVRNTGKKIEKILPQNSKPIKYI
eukprot:TRINITY_DN13753_c1_g1_i1.p2 TRINITY_DN13753_c1_g1~~TRINITY_DN13753_c1_g1_i1.p2  ORF type:complete len:198 (+),score=-17.74 TRINITY_DN13753_c1_g1_i1:26-595(+)